MPRKTRKAIAMIELIIAIVIMGITLLSAPMLIGTATRTGNVALQQEAINEASSRVNMVLTYDWDENNAKATCRPSYSVLTVTAGDPALGNTGNNRRSGVPANSNSHRFNCNGNTLAATTIGREGNVNDDIDDFSNTTLSNIPLGSGGTDYIEQNTVNIATQVTYVSDTPRNKDGYSARRINYNFSPTDSVTGMDTTNIKRISVTLTSNSGAEELKKRITMHAFSCNIGSYQYFRRIFP